MKRNVACLTILFAFLLTGCQAKDELDSLAQESRATAVCEAAKAKVTARQVVVDAARDALQSDFAKENASPHQVREGKQSLKDARAALADAQREQNEKCKQQ